MEKRHIFVGEIRAVGTTITGVIPYNSRSSDLGGFVETLAPGCFTRSIKSKNIIALLAHDQKRPLANTERGTLKLTDSPGGLMVEMRLDPNISWHSDALEATKRGDFTGLSFGFKIDQNGERWRDQNGVRVRELVTVDLREVSPVAFPAYPSTTVAVRNNFTSTRRNRDMDIIEKRFERNRIFQQIRTLENSESIDAVQGEELRKLDAEYDKLDAEIKREELREKNDLRELELSQSRGPVLGKPMPENQRSSSYGERREERQNVEERRELEMVTRALSMDGGSGDKASYLVLPTMMGRIITKAKDDTPIFAACDVMRVEKAASIMLPTLESDPADPAWTQELSIGQSDTEMDFQGRSLSPHPLAMYCKISKKLIEASLEQVVPLAEDRLGYKFSLVTENSILNGSGVNQMLGVFTNSVHGIGVDRDVSTGNTANQIKADNLFEMEATLKAGYLRRSAWCYDRTGLKQIRTLKDGNGQYLFQPGLIEGAPDRLLGRPIMISEFCPHVFTSGKYVGILGDWGFFKIAVAKNTSFEILRELFALTNQIAVVARAELDGMPAISEAFVRCKLA